MGKTTFTGPIRAGNILNTSGTTLGQNVKNVGSVVMVQTYPITQAGSLTALATDIVLPANSHILNIQILATTAWASTNTVSFGTSATATELCAATAVIQGLNSFAPGADTTRTQNWDDIGTTDKRVWVLSSASGSPAGVGTITVRYIQAHDLP
jgi:hypothetical protein